MIATEPAGYPAVVRSLNTLQTYSYRTRHSKPRSPGRFPIFFTAKSVLLPTRRAAVMRTLYRNMEEYDLASVGVTTGGKLKAAVYQSGRSKGEVDIPP